MSSKSKKTILAIASAGGHWQQLMLMRPAFAHHSITYMNTLPGLAEQFGAAPGRVVPDCNANRPIRALWATLVIGVYMLRLRPDVVISTGALPGVIALAWGRLLGSRTVWVDSVANAEEMSASGRLARRFAHLRLSQWPDVAQAEGAEYAGSIL